MSRNVANKGKEVVKALLRNYSQEPREGAIAGVNATRNDRPRVDDKKPEPINSLTGYEVDWVHSIPPMPFEDAKGARKFAEDRIKEIADRELSGVMKDPVGEKLSQPRNKGFGIND